LIDYFLTFIDQYFSYIQDENNFSNTKNYIEMEKGMGKHGVPRAIVGHVFGGCHAPCTQKQTFLVEFGKG
jgi:hypothetical protein